MHLKNRLFLKTLRIKITSVLTVLSSYDKERRKAYWKCAKKSERAISGILVLVRSKWINRMEIKKETKERI